MTHELGSIDHYWEGNTLHLPFAVENPDGTSKDISGATISWELARFPGGPAVLSDDDTGVSTTVTDAANGTFRVELAAGTTTDFTGGYRERVEIEDSSGHLLTFVNPSFDIAEP